ncbi:unnamed protein product [Pseudo-nitzschia multistriata]|uniref:60S ribosomal export protein NMD3 n=1 Tax=Pseudo-nitzschia multistriata TaxID=183589 RepID=A0A448ZSN9_9STRA|nr:unnamed protein product [Pseudo-nitzschia multistriata]
MATLSNAVNRIPCCLCGTMIMPNKANQCSSCLAQNFDLKSMIQGNTEGEPITIYQCRQCRRFNMKADTNHNYQYCEPESPQLLSICLKHIPILTKKGHSSHTNKIHIVDSSWIWTEPHSMRLKIRLTVRTDLDEVTVQQRVPVLFKINWKMCNDCDRQYTNRTWQALVQLRQKRENGSSRKGLAALEMALSKPSNRDLRRTVLKIDSSRNGLDFYFLSLPQAQHFAHFLARLAPIKIKTSQKLVSTDAKNNTANIKHTLTCDMVPLCRDDLVLVQKESRNLLGGRLALVTKVASVVHLIDASPKRSPTNQIDCADITAEAYHKNGGGGGTASANEKGCYSILQTSERLVPFVVLDMELCGDNKDHRQYEGPSSGVEKYALADVQLARESDLGANDEILSCVTHLGNLIQPGDVVLGYDLVSTASNLNTTIHKASSAKKGSSFMGASSVVGLEEVLNSNVVLQDVVLVKKISAKEQKQRELAEDMATRQINHDHEMDATLNDGGGKDTARRSGKMSKKKLRRQQKRDKKRRELEESAARMGFMDDFAEAETAYQDMVNEDDEVENNDNFAKQLEDDPELAAELRAVEKELAAAYPDEKKKSDGDGNNLQENNSNKEKEGQTNKMNLAPIEE